MSRIKLPTLTELMAFFFEASLNAGWASPEPFVVRDENEVGDRHVGYRRNIKDPWNYEDRWYVGEHKLAQPLWSHGRTIITYEGLDLFVMSYGGWYSEEAMEMAVKPALNMAYKDGIFYNGRGPCAITFDETYHYSNVDALPPFETCGQMKQFHGREHVMKLVQDAWDDCGFHNYWGMTLADLDES